MTEARYPKISIVTPCHNREAYIGDLIESVVSQGYPNLEFIVIDDGSTDHSWEIIQKYRDRLARCEHIDTKAKSPTKALQYGSKYVTGDLMTVLTDKSLLLHGSLFAIARVFNEFPEVEWVSGFTCIANEEGSIVSVVPLRKDLWEHLIPIRWHIQPESTFWRTSLWQRAGAVWDDEFIWASDFGLWARFFPLARLYHLNTIVGAYRKTSTAHGVTRRGEYHTYADLARGYLRARVPKKELLYAELYRFLRYGKPVLRVIPDRIYQYLPVLNHFCNEAITFSGSTTVKKYRRNPFRTVY